MGNISYIIKYGLYIVLNFSFVFCTWKYYNQYKYGSGDNVMTTFHNHGGSFAAYRQWIMECSDGEGIIGVSDWVNDYERVEAYLCKFIFPNKPPALRYPYYSSCHVRNWSLSNFCLDVFNLTVTIHTFATGFADDDQQFTVYRPTPSDDINWMKCCKVPGGYYIDYVSCYYMPTHDPYYEYYDSPQAIFVQCAAGYVLTGLARKTNPWTTWFNVDWLQCCRIGYGAPVAVSPPVVYGSSGTPSYIARQNIDPTPMPRHYQEQYRSHALGRSDCDSASLMGPVPQLSSWPTKSDFGSPDGNGSSSQAPLNSCSSRYDIPRKRHGSRHRHDDGDEDYEDDDRPIRRHRSRHRYEDDDDEEDADPTAWTPRPPETRIENSLFGIKDM